MTDETYNGWPNRATWNVALWLGNDEPLYRRMQEYARHQRRAVSAARAEAFCRAIWPGGQTPDHDSLNAVDWQSIADMIEEEK